MSVSVCSHCNGTGLEPNGAAAYSLDWTPMPGMTAKDFNRFLSKIDVSGDCWIWTGTMFSNGYGAFRWDGKQHRAHRLSLRMAKGDSDLSALHSCDTPACVRPNHLRWGTTQDNHDDARSRNRHARGDQHGKRKLSEDSVRAIKARYAAGGITQRALADEYGVSLGAVEVMLSGKTWSHIQ